MPLVRALSPLRARLKAEKHLLATNEELRPSNRPAHAGMMPVRTLRLILLALVAAVAGGAACLLPSDSATPRPPAFLASALGTDVEGTPERLTDAGEIVSLPRSGYELEAGTDTLALSSEDQDGDSWHQFESGAARSTPFGSETVVLDGNVVEQFLTVEKRTGPKRWRWKLETGTLKPHLRPDGSVLVSRRQHRCRLSHSSGRDSRQPRAGRQPRRNALGSRAPATATGSSHSTSTTPSCRCPT